MSELTALTIAEARDKLKAKAITATELTDAYLSAIDSANETINAYVKVTHDQARSMAKASDERIAKGEAGALEGIPLGVKDLFATKGVHTQACSHILDGFKPEYESTVTANLWADGAVMLGKLNMDEFAMGSSNETSYYGSVKNPWRANGSNADLVPGGSSGGSAAAVAAQLCAGATATDTGGSIRQPAAFTGTVGIKPTYGRVSRWGTVAFASSLDQAGPIARDVRDAAILLKSMASLDLKDTTSVDLPIPDYEAAIGKSLKGMKIGIPKEYRVDGMPDEIEELWQKGIQYLKDAGAEIIDISLPHTKYALPAYYIVAPAEASSNLARYDGVRYGLRVPGKDIADMYEQTRAAGFGKEVKRRIMIGTYVLSAGYYDAYYLRAQKVRTLIKKDFEDVFAKGVHAILTPATPSAAFGLADEDLANDPVKMYLNDIFTVTVNMAGLPGIAVPAGINDKGLPLGLQLIGRPFEEETLFQAAHAIEQAAGRFTPAKWW
ncbi:Asp-tRNA(Asn)/Glu-tRNA(Gln) amidotransferase subunit GatA [Brucella anthropi]|jgi:aspartyl-tRNA(Asn)/glutamyl-tRNA(Gln) amidotransferase subunit A|uniref:Glutamyl-tRNA(Gln) amidotransferase subunit A n=3 Tax=Brucella TaxID=234 RepID=A0A6I0DQ09_BRUAN|nr:MULTISPECIES: Asp-tRNA(Asn)/Glu-tRNA(Gln) amidotransferase subunit GatA [Brucella/Ochrobactrum group]MCR5939760.1 Asp-tRNA(Asn)/Glu-tRNA(Gln) amidotransferase subunit GatA [Ochrobactrum sp. XJ1]QOD65548.1 Asp-tRNA(Asn)/Glu-tRNA(Gln) amidotransferase subunit GatA [Ochrobactrum sp. MT180101]QTN04915.1 Asp-tRNA(Asn)/Glu-tRNA(Gln) amidotransferase subunit GatA [Ochrobactrum sp. EEELCW01]RNL46328.1 Asp-tRNA(Asn)/Glu-tRNA(Gln) amidotransferase subunit GatA [Ochrobactrum sp. MH181795]KAB2706458.1 